MANFRVSHYLYKNIHHITNKNNITQLYEKQFSIPLQRSLSNIFIKSNNIDNQLDATITVY
jgi:hypothetical protein